MSQPGAMLAQRAPTMSAARLIGLAGIMLALGFAVVLAGGIASGHWLMDANGNGIANDFVNVWAAGRLTLDGDPAAAYDWTLHKAMEVRAVGHAFDNYYGWHYPPPFLFAAALLALIPYTTAALLWLLVTLPGYLFAIRAIAGERVGIFLALGFPATLWNTAAGQNGFLTASLIGGMLATMEKHPNWSGLFLGLLSYKPQFGLLFPVVLVASGRWRIIGVAAIVTGAMAVASWFAFGTAPWLAFVDGLSRTSDAVLGEGRADLHRLQSVFGFMRAHGGSVTLAWTVHGLFALSLTAGIVALWRSRASFEIKAAGLSVGLLLATPYLYIYDLVILAVPVAFLVRLGLARGFFPSELCGLAASALLILTYPYLPTHVGLAATLIVAALVARRAFMGPGINILASQQGDVEKQSDGLRPLAHVASQQ